MPVIAHGLIAAFYVALAVGVVFGLIHGGVGIEPPLAAAMGAAVGLAGALVHQVFVRLRRDRVLDDMLAALRGSQGEMVAALGVARDELRTLMASFEEAKENLPGRGYGELAAEMRVLETLLRQAAPQPAEDGQPATPRAIPGPTAPRRDVAAEEAIAIIRDALANSRVDVYLQPVVSLPQRKTAFYETFSRLRAADGAELEPGRYLSIAEETGLITAIDNNLLFRCIQIVRKVQRRKLKLGFFCNLSPHTLRDTSFFPEFIDFMERNERLAPSLIFEFPQADLASHNAQIALHLDRLASMGFRFSIDRVETLDFDVEALVARHVTFVKVDAGMLLNRIGDSRGALELHRMKRSLDRAGIYLVVEKIEEESQVVELLDFGIDFGQGYLFDPPRLSREGE
ncbi:MAG: EAL domain-containing protein [Alphaproteobacteria bacterium]